MLLLIYSFFRYICTQFHYLLSLDNDVLETSKRRAMFYNILSQNFIATMIIIMITIIVVIITIIEQEKLEFVTLFF